MNRAVDSGPPSDAASATADHRNLPIELQIHRAPPPLPAATLTLARVGRYLRVVLGQWRRGEIAFTVLIVAVVAAMLAPMPTWLLDLLLSANLAASVLVLLLALGARNPRQLVSFPVLLLVTTLLRVSLNVSATRLILLDADAGRVIEAFGRFVVAGNFVVGLVVFVALTVVQYLVVARGAERVAEVAARFRLDSLPGQQLAIDAELRAGSLRPEEARARREALERDAHVCGAMDGAMKFVRGDVVATIVILVVNLVGGLAIGVGQRNMSFAEAVSLYSLLTIGEGLVAQIPALLVCVAAGLVVTRVADERGGFGGDLVDEVSTRPGIFVSVGALLLLLALVPGLPPLPFLLLAGLSGAAAWQLRARPPARDGSTPPDMTSLVLQLGSDLPDIDLDGIRQSVTDELGVRIPPIRIARDASRASSSYELRLAGMPLASGMVAGERHLLDKSAEDLRVSLREALLRHAAEFVGIQETRDLLDALQRTHPVLVREVVPKLVPLGVLADVLRRLVAEGIAIQPLRDIVEALGEAGRIERDASALAEHVRRALRRRITYRYCEDGRTITAWRLDPLLEDSLRGPDLEPDVADDVLVATKRSLGGRPAVIVTSADVRRRVRELLAEQLPAVAVLAYAELLPAVTVKTAGVIAVDESGG